MRLAIPLIVMLGALPGCAALNIFAPTSVRRGAIVDQDALSQLIPGTSSTADARAVLGSPTAHASFDDNTWIYISQITRTRVGRTPGVAVQKVTVLSFDQGGTLRGIRQLDKTDAKNVAMAGGSTPSPGSDASFMQQLLGNVGRFSPIGGSSTPGGGGNPLGGNSGSNGGGGGSGNSLP